VKGLGLDQLPLHLREVSQPGQDLRILPLTAQCLLEQPHRFARGERVSTQRDFSIREPQLAGRWISSAELHQRVAGRRGRLLLGGSASTWLTAPRSCAEASAGTKIAR